MFKAIHKLHYLRFIQNASQNIIQLSSLFNIGKIQLPPDFSRVALIRGQMGPFRCAPLSVQADSYRPYIHNGTVLENVAKPSENIWAIKNICEQIICALKSFSCNYFLKTKF